MNDIAIKTKDTITMKLLHFFITEKGYTPIIVHGAKDEIWLENMNAPISIIRIMSGHIHNREQLEFDLYKTHSLISRIKKKTFSFKIKALSIFLDVEDTVKLSSDKEIECINITTEEDLKKYQIISEVFPDITSKLQHTEEGIELFVKITNEINKTTEKEARKNEDVFKNKKPYVTTLLIAINVLVFALSLFFGIEFVGTYGGLYPPLVRGGEVYRLITAIFIHANPLHILMNMYALYILGSQIESFFGGFKFLAIYMFSGLMGSLLSMAFLGEAWSIGASGAIFGLFGALLYFGYHYRVYLGSAMKERIIPILILNLILGFAIPNIDQYAHLGGLVGGALMAMALGVKYKENKSQQINGLILSFLAMLFLIYVAFIYTANM
ncbi:MAG TPA: rhomboid family intramembrane serine protease [Mollicutes bacterium]|nr:rhomboid family intramembrane serine protease [Mollicutes bacterium]